MDFPAGYLRDCERVQEMINVQVSMPCAAVKDTNSLPLEEAIKAAAMPCRGSMVILPRYTGPNPRPDNWFGRIGFWQNTVRNNDTRTRRQTADFQIIE
jgi:hypothetical protein